MHQTPPRLLPRTRTEPCRASTSWDPESGVLETAFTYPQRPTASSASLRERIDQTVGIQPQRYRVVLGDVDILLQEKDRLESIQVRTQPAEWEEVSLARVPAGATDVWIEFRVDYDRNQIASLHLPVRILWDENSFQLAFRFPCRGSVSYSLAVADTVAVGLDDDFVLCELRFRDVRVPATS